MFHGAIQKIKVTRFLWTTMYISVFMRAINDVIDKFAKEKQAFP